MWGPLSESDCSSEFNSEISKVISLSSLTLAFNSCEPKAQGEIL